MSKLKPIVVSTMIERPREEVFAFLDVLANHERFTDHYLTDWSYEGPAAGVGAKAQMRHNSPNSNDWIITEVVGRSAPETIVEESVSARGKRRTRGTYTLRERPDGGTDVQFELAFFEAPRGDRLAGPLLRVGLKRANAMAMRRLQKSL